jgi:propanediol dehydratase small subunit
MTWLVVAAVVASAGVGLLVEHLRFRTYWGRTCTGRAWKSSYPEASKDEIREFLQLFVGAFGFRRSRMLRFEPMDQILSILSKRSPSYLALDPVELKDFVREVRARYGFDLAPEWHEQITLGEVFAKTRRRVA